MFQRSTASICAYSVQASRVIRNALVDLRFGSLLSGKIQTKYRDKGAVDTVNSDYVAIARLCAGSIRPDDVLVDVGCGKGRVIRWWIGQGFQNRIIGIELDPSVAHRTRRRFSRFPNIEILAGDAVDLIPSNGTVFYLYHPFHRAKMREFQSKLVKVSNDISNVRILYNNCKYIGLFENDSDWHVEHVDIGGSRFQPFDAAAIISRQNGRVDAFSQRSVSGGTASPSAASLQ